jgi:hypothetical protein
MASTVRNFIAVILAASFAAMLGGCSANTSNANAANSAAPNTSPAVGVANTTSFTIAGNPAQSATVGTEYRFTPTATYAAGTTPNFAIKNKPGWATFDTAAGTLSGSPAATDVGVDAQILITASDGTQSATLASFSISVTAAAGNPITLSWTAPSLNSNGSTLTDLAGYHIYYGASAAAMNSVITVNGAADTSLVISHLTPGTWYIAVAAFNSELIESNLSDVLPVTV